MIVGLYEFSKTCIPKLQLSKNALRYYADIAEQYAASRLRRLSMHKKWLHAICYVYHRYHQIMDNLIISFMYHVINIMDSEKAYAATAMIEHASRLVADFPKLAQFIQWFPRRDKELPHEELKRIIANCIIAYNSIILDNVYEKMVKESVAQEIIDELARVSPIAWIHILFTGRYSFEKSKGVIDIVAMAREIERDFKQHLGKTV